jgi:hypothetical protein
MFFLAAVIVCTILSAFFVGTASSIYYLLAVAQRSDHRTYVAWMADHSLDLWIFLLVGAVALINFFVD